MDVFVDIVPREVVFGGVDGVAWTHHATFSSS